jgi:hypothetical protein
LGLGGGREEEEGRKGASSDHGYSLSRTGMHFASGLSIRSWSTRYGGTGSPPLRG